MQILNAHMCPAEKTEIHRTKNVGTIQGCAGPQAAAPHPSPGWKGTRVVVVDLKFNDDICLSTSTSPLRARRKTTTRENMAAIFWPGGKGAVLVAIVSLRRSDHLF